MCLELDPILENTLFVLHSNISHISEESESHFFVQTISQYVDNIYQWFENMRSPSAVERASLMIAALGTVHKDLEAKTHAFILGQEKHPPELAQRLVTIHLLEKINQLQEALSTQHRTVQQLMNEKANYKDIQLQEELLSKMVDETQILVTALKRKRLNPNKLDRFIRIHESHENLHEKITAKLRSIVEQLGFVPSNGLLRSLGQNLLSEEMSRDIEAIWLTAKGKEEGERSSYLSLQVDAFVDKHQVTLNKFIEQQLVQTLEDQIINGKQIIKEAIILEYERVPVEVRQMFDIFQNGTYYQAEWQCNHLSADLHLGQTAPLEVKKQLDDVIQKWVAPGYIKTKFCHNLEKDWNVENASCQAQYALYKEGK